MSEAGFACPTCATTMLHAGPGQYQCPSHGPWSYEVLPAQESRGRAQVADLTERKGKGIGGGSKSGRRRKRERRKVVPIPLDHDGYHPAPPRVPITCACGCGQMFLPRQRRQQYLNPTHRRRAEQRRRRDRTNVETGG